MQRVAAGMQVLARGVIVVALLSGALAVIAGRATPPDDAVIERAEVFRDGDFVVYDAKANGTSAPAVTSNGYATYSNSTLRESYTIRLIESAGVEQLRPHLESVAATMRHVVGQRVVVAPGTMRSSGQPRTGEIEVRVSNYSPCGGQWLGCAAPTVSKGEVKSAEVWISPRLLARSHAAIDNGVRHEMGHAFGLAHFDSAWNGQIQTMHSTSFDATEYRSGDLNGFRAIAVHAQRTAAPPPPPPTTTPPAPPPKPAAPPVPATPPVVDPNGAVTDVVPTGLGIVVRGRAADPETTDPIGVLITMDDAPFELLASRRDPVTGDAHGFEVVWSVDPGPHRVCVIARNVGAGADVPFGCYEVVVASTSVGQLGLQTL